VIKKISSAEFWQVTLMIMALYTGFILAWSVSRWNELGVILWRSSWGGVVLIYVAIIFVSIFIAWMLRNGKLFHIMGTFEKKLALSSMERTISGMVYFAILVGIPYLKFTFKIDQEIKNPSFDPVLAAILYYWAIWWLILFATTALKIAFRVSWPGAFAIVIVSFCVSYQLFDRFSAVSDYPFSIGWSEASRYYYSSLYFARDIYDNSVELTSKSPARYLLQAIPFFIPGLSLWIHRFWQYLLWIILTGVAAYGISHRVISKQILLRWLFAGWIFLYFLQIGVYFHLQVMVILIVWFAKPQSRKVSSLLPLVLASAWAGISRINWFPVPSMLGIALYLLEEPISTYKNWRDYLRQPVLWALIGTPVAFLAQATYVYLVGIQDIRAVTSAFSSDLLWYRLWPNDSFPLGIVLGTMIFSGPLLLGLFQVISGRILKLHFLRWAGLGLMLLVLFAGGLVVSVKIGGGGDLHNMDAFFVLFIIIFGYFIFHKVESEIQSIHWGNISWATISLGLLLPAVFIFPALSPLPNYNQKWNNSILKTLQGNLSSIQARGGEILFMNERHLLTFGMIKNIPLVPNYEVSNLMEMAMSGNQLYLDQFYADLRSHRFAAIVAGKQNVGIKDEGGFAEENNVWNTRVSPYILCYYEPLILLEPDISKIQIFVPRTEPGDCP
jgi:hypothetical protein